MLCSCDFQGSELTGRPLFCWLEKREGEREREKERVREREKERVREREKE